MWHAMGVMLNAGGRAALAARRDRRAPYDELMAEAERWEPGVEGLTFLPYLAGERTPHADPDARGAFAGLSLRHDRGALARAVLEGVAFGLRDSLDLLRELGVDAQVARVRRAAARASDLFLRVVASALELPVERVAVDEGAAYGAALLAGVGAGAFGSVEEAAGARAPDCDDRAGMGPERAAGALPRAVPGTARWAIAAIFAVDGAWSARGRRASLRCRIARASRRRRSGSRSPAWRRARSSRCRSRAGEPRESAAGVRRSSARRAW